RFQIVGNNFQASTANGPALFNENASATNPTLIPNKASIGTGIGSNAADQVSIIAGGIEILRITEAAEEQVTVSPGALLGSAALPALAFGDGDTGFHESIDDTLQLSTAGVAQWAFNVTGQIAVNGGGAGMLIANASDTVPTLTPRRNDPDSGIGSFAADSLSIISGGLEMLRLVETGVAATDQVRIALTIGGAVGTPAFAFGDGDTGLFESADDILNIVTLGAIAIQMTGGNDVALFDNGVEVARTESIANGGFEVSSGNGFHPVVSETNFVVRRQDGDLGAVNDATSNPVPDLAHGITVAAGEHCIIEGMLRFESASATPGLRWQVDVSGAALTDSSVAWTL
ncbi:MAG: hypothetical protein ACE1ZA_19025, partial [Pseudomonadales bacterium]